MLYLYNLVGGHLFHFCIFFFLSVFVIFYLSRLSAASGSMIWCTSGGLPHLYTCRSVLLQGSRARPGASCSVHGGRCRAIALVPAWSLVGDRWPDRFYFYLQVGSGRPLNVHGTSSFWMNIFEWQNGMANAWYMVWRTWHASPAARLGLNAGAVMYIVIDFHRFCAYMVVIIFLHLLHVHPLEMRWWWRTWYRKGMATHIGIACCTCWPACCRCSRCRPFWAVPAVLEIGKSGKSMAVDARPDLMTDNDDDNDNDDTTRRPAVRPCCPCCSMFYLSLLRGMTVTMTFLLFWYIFLSSMAFLAYMEWSMEMYS